jgi:excisionase family DNA binding protein
MAAKKMLTTGEVAKYCGVNFRTVIRWIKRGDLKAIQLPGRGDNRIEVADFLDFLKKFRMSIPEEFLEQEWKILIVDDDQRMAQSIQRVLRQKGFTTLIAADGFKAGAILGTYKPALMTLDIKMPGMTGLEVIKYIRSTDEFKNTKILVVSGALDNELSQAVKSGADDVLSKPFKNEALLQKVEKLTGRVTS